MLRRSFPPDDHKTYFSLKHLLNDHDIVSKVNMETICFYIKELNYEQSTFIDHKRLCCVTNRHKARVTTMISDVISQLASHISCLDLKPGAVFHFLMFDKTKLKL